MPEPWLSAEDVALHLGVTKDTVYTWIAQKGMPAHKVGRLWKFQASEVDAWVRRGGAGPAGRNEPTRPASSNAGYASNATSDVEEWR